MKLATQDRSFFGQSFMDKLLTVNKLGFEGLEIGGDVLIHRFDEIKKAVNSTGVPISSICGGYKGWIGDFDEENRMQAVKDIAEIFNYTAEIGAEGVIAPAAFGMFSKKLPPFENQRSEEEELNVLHQSLFELNAAAGLSGSILLLEPLNRYEDHMINRLDQAKQLIEKGEYKNIQILADLFHMNIEESDMAESIYEIREYIGHVHLADSNRLEPGKGHINYEPIFETLHSIGYSKYISVECELSQNNDRAYLEMKDYLKDLIPTTV